MEPPPEGGPDQVAVHIDAPPERIWALVTDLEQMGQLSPECTGGRWLDGATAPVVGARFKGFNKRGPARWSTTNTVVVAEPHSAFAFETKQSGMRWSYRLEPDSGGTTITEQREEYRTRPILARAFTRIALGGGESHEGELRVGMAATLARLKELAEVDRNPES